MIVLEEFESKFLGLFNKESWDIWVDNWSCQARTWFESFYELCVPMQGSPFYHCFEFWIQW